VALSSSHHPQHPLRIIDCPMLFTGTLACMPQLFDTLFNGFRRNVNSMMAFFSAKLQQGFPVFSSQANFKVTIASLASQPPAAYSAH
jgi:hypothetical protein